MNLQTNQVVTFPTPWQNSQDFYALTHMDSSPPISSPPISSPPISAPFMTMKIWTRALQEQQNIVAKRRTQCSMFPAIWKNIAVSFQVQWKKEGWACFQKKNTNLSDFKSRLTKWIVLQRKQTLISDIISEYQDHTFAAAVPKLLNSNQVRRYLNIIVSLFTHI